MFDLELKLRNFKSGVEEIKDKNFSNFSELEKEYCKLINTGTEIRNHLINNPNECDENSLKVLTNQTSDYSLLADKFKCLFSIITLTKDLLNHYQQYVFDLLKKEDYNYAVTIYEQMFKFSHNYTYKLEIANISYKFLNNPLKCYMIYKEIEPYMENDPRFLWGFSDVYSYFGNYFRQFVYIQKAVNAELKQFEAEREGA